jgi:hypothetical protein
MLTLARVFVTLKLDRVPGKPALTGGYLPGP